MTDCIPLIFNIDKQGKREGYEIEYYLTFLVGKRDQYKMEYYLTNSVGKRDQYKIEYYLTMVQCSSNCVPRHTSVP